MSTTKHKHKKKGCVLSSAVVSGENVAEVYYELPVDGWDSGFQMFAASEADRTSVSIKGVMIVCLDCFIDRHPEAGVGMDIAREHGRALHRDGKWRVAA